MAVLTIGWRRCSWRERVTPISAPGRKLAPVVYDDDPGDANGAVARAKDGSLPAWALPLAAWQSGHGAMRARPTGTGKRQHDFAE